MEQILLQMAIIKGLIILVPIITIIVMYYILFKKDFKQSNKIDGILTVKKLKDGRLILFDDNTSRIIANFELERDEKFKKNIEKFERMYD